MSCGDDPFVILGVRPEASAEEVKQAYRRLAMRWHPDRNASSAAATEFRKVHAAYERFLERQRAAEWERRPTASPNAAKPPANASVDYVQGLTLTLEEAALGCQKSVDVVGRVGCRTCQGGGRQKHDHLVPCRVCNGCGRVGGAGGWNSRCAACAGRGYVRETDCPACAGSGRLEKRRTLVVTVPPGVDDGERLRLARQAPLTEPHDGADGLRGDLYLEIRLAAHPLFVRRGRDLHCEVPVSVFCLLGGGRVEVPTLAGSCTLDLAADAHRPTEHRLPGLGFPGKPGQPAGDLVIRLQCVVPAVVAAKDAPLLAALETSLRSDLAARAPALAVWETQLASRRQPATG